ncbi:hypothetical protein Tco_1205616 [Tanacetum coccineum]
MKKIREAVKELSEVCTAESDEDPDEVLDDDVSSESATLRALRRAALCDGVITSHNPSVLFLAVIHIRLGMASEAVLTEVDMSQVGDAVVISVDGAGGVGVNGISCNTPLFDI